MSRCALSLCCIFLFIFLQFPIVVSTDIQDDIRYGPILDKVVYKELCCIAMALEEGVVDIGTIYPSDFNYLDAAAAIDIYEAPENRYRSIIFNCDNYPLNISGFRRAFAFAFNKIEVVDDIYQGHASPHDSLLPSINRWCAEDLLDFHYYEDESERGNALLDELGFTMNSTTGFRDAPNGEPFTVDCFEWYPTSITDRKTANLTREALDSLNIDTDWHHKLVMWPSGWDIMASGKPFEYDELDFENEFSNLNFRNDTYDFWMAKFRNGKTYEEVYEASIEIQKILHHNVPFLVVCQSNILQGYRNDHFQGHVADLSRYISGPWSLRKIHKIDGSYGGTISISLGWDQRSFNIYVMNEYRHSNIQIIENLYSSLYSRDSNMNPIPDLAESMQVETNSDNPSVPQNHTRFTFDILQNATWSDGVPLTAEDIAFTFIYMLESRVYGNPAADSLNDLVSVYAPSTYKVVIEFSTESYWHFFDIAYEYIIPKHIFTEIGYSGWNTWDPVFDAEAPHVTCGPYVLTDADFRDSGIPYHWYELSQNPLYHWYPPPPPPNVTNTSAPTPTPFPILQIMPYTILSASAVVIVGVVLLLIKERK